MFTKVTPRLVTIFCARLRRLGIASHAGLRFTPNLEGYRWYSFGGRSGPSIQVNNLFHEIAHACEFGGAAFAKRANEGGYVFKVNEVWVYDRMCVEPATSQPIQRELRVFAIQYHLMLKAGYKHTREQWIAEHVKSMVYMPDIYHVKGNNDEARLEWCHNEVDRLIDLVNVDECIDSLKLWLDKTARRLKRMKPVDTTKYVKYRGYATYNGQGELV